MTTHLTITELARRTGLSTRALRFYDARGLAPAGRSAAGQRRYGPAEVARLHQVAALKRAGFTLARIGALLGGPAPDLARLIDAQLDALAVERDRIDEAEAALRAARARLAAGRALDIDTFCALIKQGEQAMTEKAWQQVYDRYYTPDEQAVWAEAKQRAFAGMDLEKYGSDWKALTDRIEAALPLDPASPQAAAFVAEWRALQAPLVREVGAAAWNGAATLYDRMDEWSDLVEPPFSPAIWAFIKAAGQRVGTGASPE